MTTTTIQNDLGAAPIDPNIEALFQAGAHVGYFKSRMHPKMENYMFCTRNEIKIFNLQKTEDQIKKAEVFLKELAKNGKTVLWIGSKPSARTHIKSIGVELKMPFIALRWLGGTLTNFKIIEGRLKYLENLENEEKTGILDKYVKKEKMKKIAEMKKLNLMFEGLRELKAIPDAVVIVDPEEEKTAFRETLKLKNVKIVALLNSDCNPDGIHYPIPVNDNASESISLVLNRLATVFKTNKQSS